MYGPHFKVLNHSGHPRLCEFYQCWFENLDGERWNPTIGTPVEIVLAPFEDKCAQVFYVLNPSGRIFPHTIYADGQYLTDGCGKELEGDFVLVVGHKLVVSATRIPFKSGIMCRDESEWTNAR